ncbi:hypothetical protein RJ639_004104 [Escallonia herrerae]|uniref:NAF domain-containing protein n=1 Tax=Escallonia herrerae TaxID=1293975 RepID=A0AA89AWP7_9ASTE|nr:hypothetical protein RJ639_004104 [Escallonia herrerae]
MEQLIDHINRTVAGGSRNPRWRWPDSYLQLVNFVVRESFSVRVDREGLLTKSAQFDLSSLFKDNKRVDLSPLFEQNEREDKEEMRFVTARPASYVISKLEEVGKAVKFRVRLQGLENRGRAAAVHRKGTAVVRRGSGRRVVCGLVGEERERKGESKLPAGNKTAGVREGAAGEVGKGIADEVGKGTVGVREGAAGGK